MDYLNNYKKQQFRNVYFITGTATGGKTTISKELAKKYNFLRYDVDEEFARHKALSNFVEQPNMNKVFKNADEFFMRNKDEYIRWLKDNSKEQLKFILDDLVQMSKDKKVVCDLHLTVDEASKIANNNQIVFLIRKNNDNIIDDYCNRKSHEDFNTYINSSTNPIFAKENCNAVLRELNNERCETIRNSNFFWIERDENSTVQETLQMVEKHFNLVCN